MLEHARVLAIPSTKRRNTQKKESWGACACMQWLVKCCRGLDKSLKSYWYDVVRATPIHTKKRAYSLTLCHARTHTHTQLTRHDIQAFVHTVQTAPTQTLAQ